jgi:hypothetical protein
MRSTVINSVLIYSIDTLYLLMFSLVYIEILDVDIFTFVSTHYSNKR